MSSSGLLLVRPPARSLAQGILSHIADQRGSISYERAHEQWQAYVDVFRKHGWRVEQVKQDDTLADSVFVEDGLVSVNNLSDKTQKSTLILTSPGNVAREAEIVGIRARIEQAAGSEGNLFAGNDVRQIEKPGTLDGGDVLKVPSQATIYIGASARTNAEGRRQFQQIVEPLGWKVVSVPVVKALHLKSMLTALPDGTVIGYESFVEDTSVFARFIGMPEPEGVAVVHLDQRSDAPTSTLIMSSRAPQSTAKLVELGYQVETVDIEEFERLEGCVTCMSVRVR